MNFVTALLERRSLLYNRRFINKLLLLLLCWKEEEVCYCVVKKMECSSEYFGRYCQKLLNKFLFYIYQNIQL